MKYINYSNKLDEFKCETFEFLAENLDQLPPRKISLIADGDVRKIGFVKTNMDWEYTCGQITLSEKALETFRYYIRWKIISWSQYLTEQFMERNYDKLDWPTIVRHQSLSEDFILKNNLLDKFKSTIKRRILDQDFCGGTLILSNQFIEEIFNL